MMIVDKGKSTDPHPAPPCQALPRLRRAGRAGWKGRDVDPRFDRGRRCM